MWHVLPCTMTYWMRPRDPQAGSPWALRRNHRPTEHKKNQADGSLFCEQIYSVYGKETNRQNGSDPMDRDIYEELKTLKGEMRWVAWFSPRPMVICRPGLLPGPMAEFMDLCWCLWLLLPEKPQRIGQYRVGFTPHWLQHEENLSCHSLAEAYEREPYTSPGQHNFRADPVQSGMEELALRVWK